MFVLRQMDCLLLSRAIGICWHVLHEGRSSTVIEEVDGHPHVTTGVCGCETTVKVWCEVDFGAIVGALGEDAWYHDADVGLSVCGASAKVN